MNKFQTLDKINFSGQRVLVRADLNVPMKDGKVSDEARLRAFLPTLTELTKAGAKVIVLSHFGRPEGQANPKYTLRPVAEALAALFGAPVAFAEDCVGPKAEATVKALKNGEVLVLENTRFHAGEEANDQAFTKQLAALGDIYVNDAFSCAHRAHASTEGLAHLLPSAAGRLMQRELEALGAALESPKRPLAAIVGGSKISTKLDLLNNLVGKVDLLVLGGGMANTFLASRGVNIGKSLSEPDMYDTARQISATAAKHGCEILLPTDVVVAREFKAGAASEDVSVSAIPADVMALDLGSQAVAEIIQKIAACKSVVWNGPLGAFEITPFDRATNTVARAVADLTRAAKIMSVAGGGDTVAALANAGCADGVSYLSMAGGAFLEWLEGKTLPGVAALQKAKA